MGVTARVPARALSAWSVVRSGLTLQRLAVASVVVNVLIVVTGGAVRLTGSGLGCPTFPSCGDGSLTPTKKFGVHGIIEFTNRQLTFVVVAVVIATVVVAILDRREVRLAVLLAASIPAQALLGGLTVLTHLNPWLVSTHFLLSMAIIAVAFVLWWRVSESAGADVVATSVQRAGVGLVALTAVVLLIGTVVTGSGPHAGDADTSGKVHRNGLDVGSMSQLHADVVMLLIGVTICFAFLARAVGGSNALRRAAWLLLGVELGQGLIGFVQYFTDIPAILVGFHMFGACLAWLAALNVWARTRSAVTHTETVARRAGRSSAVAPL
jgi:heme a synthase